MTTLMTANSFEAEHERMREDINKAATQLSTRKLRWAILSTGGLLITITLFIAGIVMILHGALPDSLAVSAVDLDQSLSESIQTLSVENGGANAAQSQADPFAEIFERVAKGPAGTLLKIAAIIMLVFGLIAGIARQSLISLATGIGGGIFMYQAPDILEALVTKDAGSVVSEEATPAWSEMLSKAVSGEHWLEAKALIKQHDIEDSIISLELLNQLIAADEFNDAIASGNYSMALDMSGSPELRAFTDTADLQARLNYMLNQHASAAAIVRDHKLYELDQDSAWVIENAWKNADSGARMSDASKMYYQDKVATAARGYVSLVCAAITLILTLIAGFILADLSRNLRKLDLWLKETRASRLNAPNDKLDPHTDQTKIPPPQARTLP